MIGTVTVVMDWIVTLTGAGRPTTALQDLTPRTTHGERGVPGEIAAYHAAAPEQGLGQGSVLAPSKVAESAPSRLTQRQRSAMLPLAGQILENGAHAHCHVVELELK